MNAEAVPRTREEKAGEIYTRMLRAVTAGEHEASMLPRHLRLMLRGTADFAGPLWQVRIFNRGLPTEKVFTLDKFEDYLLKPPRDGLGFESLYQVKQLLLATRDGEEGLKLLKAEIPDFDQRANAGKAEFAVERIEEKGPVREHGTNRYSRDDNIMSTGEQGTSQEYTGRRLLALGRTDLLDLVKAGELSMNKAAIEAGIRPVTIQFSSSTDVNDAADRIIQKLGLDYARALKKALPD